MKVLRGVDSLSFFVYDVRVRVFRMDKEKVKLIIRNMELLLDSLKVEVYGKKEYNSLDDVEYYEENEHYDWEQ